jgi:hypothetical protein
MVVATNLPGQSPRIGVRLLDDEMIFGERLHATIVGHGAGPSQAKPAIRLFKQRRMVAIPIYEVSAVFGKTYQR